MSKFGTRYDDGGNISKENKITYSKWKGLVNMTSSELENFLDTKEGKEAGLSKEKADRLGIHYGRESAKWILKMKDTNVSDWTPAMWKWANRQISFISRMKGNKGGLYDSKGNKTRKHTSLLIWGHNPKKYKAGGEIPKCDIRLVTTQKFIVDGEIQLKEIYEKNNNDCTLQLLYTDKTKDLFQIAGLFVDKAKRNKGLGSQLISFSKNRASDLGFSEIVYLVADYKGKEYNDLISFCKNNGFEFVQGSTRRMIFKINHNDTMRGGGNANKSIKHWYEGGNWLNDF